MVLKNGNAIPLVPAVAPDTTDHLAKVAPVNNLLHSLFENVTCFFGPKEVNSSYKYYPWKVRKIIFTFSAAFCMLYPFLGIPNQFVELQH